MPADLPYSPVVRSGEWLVVSGQLGQVNGTLVPGGVGPELDRAISNLREVLGTHGATLADVVKTTLFIIDLDRRFSAANEVYAEHFAPPRPARTAIGVASLPLGASVEIEAWARCPVERTVLRSIADGDGV